MPKYLFQSYQFISIISTAYVAHWMTNVWRYQAKKVLVAIKSVMKANIFHMYKIPIESVHVVQYGRQKQISARNVEEDPNGYGCGP